MPVCLLGRSLIRDDFIAQCSVGLLPPTQSSQFLPELRPLLIGPCSLPSILAIASTFFLDRGKTPPLFMHAPFAAIEPRPRMHVSRVAPPMYVQFVEENGKQ